VVNGTNSKEPCACQCDFGCLCVSRAHFELQDGIGVCEPFSFNGPSFRPVTISEKTYNGVVKSGKFSVDSSLMVKIR